MNVAPKVAGEQTIRQPNVDALESVHNLTTYHDVEDIASQAVPGQGHTMITSITDYLPSQEVDVLLSRSYKLLDFGWNSTTVHGEGITPALNFPEELYKKEFLSQLIRRYAYFRCQSLTLTFRIQSTPFHYGMLMISHVYDGRFSGGRTEYFFQRGQNRPVLLSAMPGSSVEIKIPWNSPEAWYQTQLLETTLKNALAEVYIDVMVPLDSVGTTIEPLTVSVYANFDKPEVMGPNVSDPYPIPPAVIQPRATRRVLVPVDQSIPAEALAKGLTGLMTSYSDGETDHGAQPMDFVGDLAGLAIKSASLVLDKPTSVQANTLSTVEWAKDMPSGYGQSFGTKLALDPQAAIDPTFDVIAEKNHTILELCSIPSFVDYQNLSAATEPDTPFWSKSIDPIFNRAYTLPAGAGIELTFAYMSYFSLPFRYWRGSITYHLNFVTSKFVSARVRFSWLPNATSTSSLDGRTGDVYSRVIDVNGDTNATVTIPFAYDKMWARIRKPGEALNDIDTLRGVIQMELVSNIVSNVAAPNIGVVTWIAAGPDYQLGYMNSSLLSNKGSTTGWKYRWPNDQSVWDLAGTADPIVKHTTNMIERIGVSESYEDVLSLAKRFVEVKTIVAASPNKTVLRNTPFQDPLYQVDGRRNDVVSHLIQPFMYYRGSLRFKFMRTVAQKGKAWTLTRYDGEEEHMNGPFIAASPGDFTNQIEVETPYFNVNPYSPTKVDDDNSCLLATIGEDSLALCSSYYAVGDDFQLFALFAVPVLFVPPT